MKKSRRLPFLLLLLAMVACLRLWVSYREMGPVYEWVAYLKNATNASHKRDLLRRSYKDTLEWEGRLIPEGTFLMGSQSKEEPYLSAWPEFPANLPSFYIGERNVSRWEWNTVVQRTKFLGYDFRNWKQEPDWDSDRTLETLELPMEAISWLDAVAWCNAKSELHGRDPAYWTKAKTKSGWGVFRGSKAATVQVSIQEDANGYRLPTEAEWERAARGSRVRARYAWGDRVPENFDSQPNSFGLLGVGSKPGCWCWDKFAPYTAWEKNSPMVSYVKGSNERVHRGRPEKSGQPAPVFAREHFDEGDPVGGLRIAASFETPWVRVTGGSYQMGDTYVIRELNGKPLSHRDPREIKEGAPDEFPVRTVHVTEFQIYRSEVPLEEWLRVREWAQKNGYDFDNPGTAKRMDHPVTGVSWYDVLKWCNARSEMDGLAPCYYTAAKFNPSAVYRTGRVDVSQEMIDGQAAGYRLPSEAEWEKAAKAGGEENRYPCGPQIGHTQAVFMDERNDAKGGKKTLLYHPVFTGGPGPARTFASGGLYHMTGNVREWCWDMYAHYPRFPGEVPETDPGPGLRSIRGGSWRKTAWECRSSRRFKLPPSQASDELGFRIVKK